MEDGKLKVKANGAALLPFILFVLVYLATGLILNARGVEMAFYQVAAPVCILPAIVLAFIMFEGMIDDKFNSFVRGCGDENIIIMCLIYILAGAFATVSKTSGGVDSVVNFALSMIPVQYITAGIFLISCFISLSTGTSVGTISAVGPIAVGVAQKEICPWPWLSALWWAAPCSATTSPSFPIPPSPPPGRKMWK